MRRRPLAPAFVTTVLSSGCAWTYGAGAHYAQSADNPNALGATARGAWGFGGERNALVIATDVGVGSSPRYGGVWMQSHSRLEWSWLPGPNDFGLRLGAGSLALGGTRGPQPGIGPAISAEVLYGLSVSPDTTYGYRGTLVGLALQAGYDVSNDAGPMMVLALSITRDGTVPFGNPPRPQVRVEPVRVNNVMATDPPEVSAPTR